MTLPTENPLNEIPESLPHAQRLIRIFLVSLGIRFNLSLLEFLIQIREEHPEPETSNNSDTEHGSDNSVAVPVSIVREVPDVRASYVAELAECVDHGDCYGTLGGWTGEGCTDPRVEDDEAIWFMRSEGCFRRSGLIKLTQHKKKLGGTERRIELPCSVWTCR